MVPVVVATFMLDFSNVREITAAFFEFGIVIHLFVVLSDVRFLQFLSFAFVKFRFLIRSALLFVLLKTL